MTPTKTAVAQFRVANIDDLGAIAAIHKVAYSANHFTARFPDALLREYYRDFLSDGTEIRLALASGVRGDDRIVGFSVHGVGIPQKIAAFKRRCARKILSTSLRHPGIATRKAVKALIARFARQTPCVPAEYLLLSVAVTRPMDGIGKALLAELLQTAGNRGHSIVGLYVNDDNIRAINAYYLTGFRIKDVWNRQFYMEANTRS